jgi:hypothetical protein
MSLCGACTKALQGVHHLPRPYDAASIVVAGPSSRDRFVQHESVLGYLAAVNAKCYICWRTCQRLGETGQRLLRKLGAALKRYELDGVVEIDTDTHKVVPFSEISTTIDTHPEWEKAAVVQWLNPKSSKGSYVVTLENAFRQSRPPSQRSHKLLQDDEIKILLHAFVDMPYVSCRATFLSVDEATGLSLAGDI